ncbi:SpoIIE family protein phosphatase [Geotalea sp. SG265]|uniref:SpoIIE family protein phosphatase n=1 Tax=Geotalea sp. SG265 TaxID=2922867 RepID=UPI001FAF5F2A|nr:SpoIIE family protein phosphatase [Geotalea sp. SG265]
MNGQVIPTLGEILRKQEPISSHLPVAEVVEIFQKNPSLLALPIITESTFTGIISRRALFYTHLGRPFAMELFGKKPIISLGEKECVTMDTNLDVNQALSRLLEFDPALETDCFVVTETQRYKGMVSVSDLMMTISMTQASLVRQLESLSERIRDEVKKAGEIQQALLPLADFRFNGVTVSGEITTSSEIGGDYFDYFQLDQDRIGLLVGDVSGHGVQSGMVTTAAKASLHCLIAQGVDTPAGLLFGMNNAVLATARQTLLMTCLIAVIDTKNCRLTFANAGHNFPYLHRSSSGLLMMLDGVSGFPLGFEENNQYGECSTSFLPGDSVLLYSDGIVECTDLTGEEFGYDRLATAIAENIAMEPAVLRRILRQEATRFTGSASFPDDVTLLIASSTDKGAMHGA